MGSPFGPTLANIFMGNLESKLADELSYQVLYIRYMENCLVISQTESILCFSKLNVLNEKNTFTMEMEINN